MAGTVGVIGLRIECIVGVDEVERRAPQPILVDIEIDYDFAAAARSDAIDDAVDYARIAAQVDALVRRRRFRLLETLTVETARMLLDDDRRIETVRIGVRKPNALPTATASFARLERSRR